ncbi:Nucleolar protein 16 [Aphelenchoides bicaudatus]|nr:Nucleolar protein 16 [Aphelenchoides bicaudatus]
MARSVKAVRNPRAKKTFRNKRNQNKRSKQKLKKKVGKPNGSHGLASVWDKKKSIDVNMRSKGLILNSNKFFNLRPNNEPEAMDIEEARSNNISEKPEKKIRTKKAKGYAKELEKQARIATQKQQASRPPPSLSASDLQFCEKMVKKHGLDYEAMAKDRDNIYQNTSKQFERKIKTFQKSKAYHDVVVKAMEE